MAIAIDELSRTALWKSGKLRGDSTGAVLAHHGRVVAALLVRGGSPSLSAGIVRHDQLEPLVADVHAIRFRHHVEGVRAWRCVARSADGLGKVVVARSRDASERGRCERNPRSV